MIRSLRRLVPAARQENWPRFVHKVALPLRKRLAPLSAEPLGPGEVFITRRRYDRAAAIAIPASLAAALLVWRLFAFPALLLMPLVIAACWLFLRYATLPGGERIASVSGRPGGRAATLCGLIILPASALVMNLARLAGLDDDSARALSLVSVSPALPIMMVAIYRTEKRRKRDDEIAAAAHAPDHWEQGELGLPVK